MATYLIVKDRDRVQSELNRKNRAREYAEAHTPIVRVPQKHSKAKKHKTAKQIVYQNDRPKYRPGMGSKDFYRTREWFEIRYKAILKYGRVCACCRSIQGPHHVDHVKPRSKYPTLELELANLQVLCEACNLGKSNTDETDWRED